MKNIAYALPFYLYLINYILNDMHLKDEDLKMIFLFQTYDVLKNLKASKIHFTQHVFFIMIPITLHKLSHIFI